MSLSCSSGLTTITAILCSLMLFACTGQTKEGSEQAEVHRPVWPKPPQQARIEFIQTVAKPEDLGITPGFLGRLASVFVGREEIRLVRPTAAVMTQEEVLYVADPGSKGVHRFDIKETNTICCGLKRVEPSISPVSLTVGADDRVYVSDSALNQIFSIDRQAKHAVPFKTSVDLDQPTGLVFDVAKDRLYVVNTRRHQIVAFDHKGEALFSFGKRGAGAGDFNYPTHVWSDASSGEIWVTDSLNFRVQRFTGNGEFITAFSGVGDATGDLPRPKGVATDSAGHVYIMDALLNTMQIFNREGELLLYLGHQGRGIGQFWLPVGIFIDRTNRIFVADSFNNRVQVFRLLEDKG